MYINDSRNTPRVSIRKIERYSYRARPDLLSLLAITSSLCDLMSSLQTLVASLYEMVLLAAICFVMQLMSKRLLETGGTEFAAVADATSETANATIVAKCFIYITRRPQKPADFMVPSMHGRTPCSRGESRHPLSVFCRQRPQWGR
jgi:hypothetical protein